MVLSVEHIRKLMGWCPQKDFALMYAKPEKQEIYFNSTYKKRANPDEKISAIVDIEHELAIIIGRGFVALIILFIASFIFPGLRYFIFLPVFLAALVLLIHTRTNVEFASNGLIIRRWLFKPVMVSKASILKTEIVTNNNHSMRWSFLPMAIIVLIFSAKNAMRTIGIISKDIAQGAPIPVFYPLIFAEITMAIFLLVLFYMWKIRLHYSNGLKITLSNSNKITFYADNPLELADKLGVAI